METKLFRVDPLNPDEEVINFAAGILREGGLVAFPTETVYGLGANALDPEAVEKIFRAKGRPQDNPVIVHVSRPEGIKPLVTGVPPLAQKLMDMFWPGPLTLLFPRSSLVPSVVTAGLPLVAIRMPDHPVAQRLIDVAGVPVAAPSANTSGRPSPTSADEVYSDLNGKVDIIIDAGPTNIGVESTVLDVSGAIPRILRPGGVSREELVEALGRVEVAEEFKDGVPPSPGMKYRHYAPCVEMYLARGDSQLQRKTILAESVRQISRGKNVAVLASSENLPHYASFQRAFPGKFLVIELGSRQDLSPVAARLFSSLRLCEKVGADIILSETFPVTGLGLAIANRLERASGGREIEDPSRRPLRVLMVCSGNTCRSPMAEGLMKKVWADMGQPFPLEVISRGTGAVPGLPASQEAIQVMKKRGVDLGTHVSRPVTVEDVEKADLVIAMTGAHKSALLSRFPQYADKIHTLAEMVPDKVKGDVSDPIGLGEKFYEKTAALLEEGLKSLAARMAAGEVPLVKRENGEEGAPEGPC
ncbi:MAG: threonylcarbamoyl-AMP synthase [Candidatus Fermentithermobacillus carboniphilus]|uniref:L-threonylcarbamoyladenylate synthase n=1 Tax=Candidatus Fermentithermobacillus carboniphilus TaxID=3085328 RepID=A0AAT9L9Z0_9FIRM|nr:MAG: threonylcarbamoyl-AMP synthase [Candidatus Fermentithermobacillus carboniphilus]